MSVCDGHSLDVPTALAGSSLATATVSSAV